MSESRATVIPLPVEIDIANADQVRLDLVAAIDQGYAVVVADMSRTSFCDCAGVAALLSASSHAVSSGGHLRIAATAKPVLRTFELTGVRLALLVYPNSLAALHEPATGTARQCGRQAAETSPVAAAPAKVSRLTRTDVAESAPRLDRSQCPLPSCWCSATRR